jgi:uncharacterized RDD family membrane protein YckC
MSLFLWVIAAFIYDLIILSALSMVISALFLLMFGEGFYQGEWSRHLFQLTWVGLITSYFGWSWLHGGQTIGMKAWRLKVMRCDGQPLTHIDVFTRLAAATVNLFVLNLGWLGYLSNNRQSLTDKLSATTIERIAKSS